MPDLISLGEALIEFNQQLGTGLFHQGFGGDTSNTAIAAARLGTSVGYITRVGADVFGDRLLQLWRDEQISVDTVARDRDAPTGVYFVTHDGKGHHFQYYRTGSAASRMTADMLPLAAITSARILHVSAISQGISEMASTAAFAAMDAAKKAGVRVCYDSNLRLALWSPVRAWPVIRETITQADIFRPSLDDARLLTGIEEPQAIVDHFLGLGPRCVILTMGAAGVIAATPDRRQHLGGYRVNAVDATGAGDAFNGALLSRLIAGADLFAAAAFANAAAALATTGYGAVAPLPRAGAIRALMDEQAIELIEG
jgi:2-dehydro-3-deoxygluconokinase